jgi:hypothetical protein
VIEKRHILLYLYFTHLLFSDPNKNVESDETTLCDNISNTLISSGNENDTCTSGSEEVDITDNEHGNIFAHHVPYNDDIMLPVNTFLFIFDFPQLQDK